MSRVGADELPGSMAVLGLIIEQPNQTVREVGQCVESRFARARFARSIAHSTLPRLAQADRVRRSYIAPGANRSADRYEPTKSGRTAFRQWMFDEAPDGTRCATIPALREAMYGRIELCGKEDLPRLIDMAREEERVSADLYAQASIRLRRHLTQRADPDDMARKIREVLLYVDPMHWASRAERYKQIADRLEDLRREGEQHAC